MHSSAIDCPHGVVLKKNLISIKNKLFLFAASTIPLPTATTVPFPWEVFAASRVLGVPELHGGVLVRVDAEDDYPALPRPLTLSLARHLGANEARRSRLLRGQC